MTHDASTRPAGCCALENCSKMPRKRRNKKDPVAQKLNFDDEEVGEAELPGDIRRPSPVSKSGTEQEGSGPEADAPPTASDSERPGDAALIPTDFAHRDRLRLARPGGLTDDDESPNRFLVSCVCVICLILVVQWIKSEGTYDLKKKKL